jgi:hypothetical protein
MRRRGAALLLFAIAFGVAGAARAEDKWVLIGALGAFDLPLPNEVKDTAPAYYAELRLKPGIWHFHPHLGFQGTTDGMVYGFGGVHLDFPIGHLRLVPSGSVGFYDDGENDKNLDGLVEFRIGAGVAWQFDNGFRLGGTWYHMSNAYTAERNPGAEMLFAEFGFAFPCGAR